jgi:hypothetical protein
MKRYIVILVLVGLLCIGAANKVGTNAVGFSSDWVQKGNYPILKMVWTDIGDSETATFDFSGKVLRVVVSGDSNDSDGDIVLKDVSDANYAVFENKLSGGSFDYVLECLTQNSNVGLGVPTGGGHTITVTDCNDANNLTVYIYFGK